MKGFWTIRFEPDLVWSFPDTGPASEQYLLELLRNIGQPDTAGRRVVVHFIHTAEFYGEEIQRQEGKPNRRRA